MKKEFEYLTKNLKSSIGGGNISSLYLKINPFNKESRKRVEVIVTLKMIKRFNVKNIEKADELYETIQKFYFDLEKIVGGIK